MSDELTIRTYCIAGFRWKASTGPECDYIYLRKTAFYREKLRIFMGGVVTLHEVSQ